MKKLKFIKRKPLVIAGVVIALCLLAFQAYVDVCVYVNVINPKGGRDGGAVIATLVGAAAYSLDKPAPVDAASGQVYIPEAHIVMPAYTGLGQIEYLYENGKYVPSGTEINLTSTQIVNLAKDKLWVGLANDNNRAAWHGFSGSKMFSAVPSLQACARGVQIFYAKQNSLGGDYVFQGSRPLKDGRTLYIYSETGCQQNQVPVISLAKNAQSY